MYRGDELHPRPARHGPREDQGRHRRRPGVTLDAGVVTSLVGQLLVNVGQLLTQFVKFWADNQTVNIAVWNQLNDGADLRGLTVAGSSKDRELNWPPLSPADVDDVQDKADWEHKP